MIRNHRHGANVCCRAGARPPPAGRRRAPGGFTLVELLIVVAVVALAAAAVAPAVGSLTGANARKAAGEMAGAMRW
ncbi:MAG TPA: prepilin-type N-terminal cleavage/methylation domain-containing protein, partial [Anaeromyxobacteraceae bacterium]|nr:prepilin-type N-terminal cleavage/methylation domain-containing protein [Anaeromyxobacteraceae bacterium]